MCDGVQECRAEFAGDRSDSQVSTYSSAQAPEQPGMSGTPSHGITTADVSAPAASASATSVTSSSPLSSGDNENELAPPDGGATLRVSAGGARIQPGDLIRDLPDWIKSGVLDDEFKSLPHMFPFSYDAGRSDSVAKKNRRRDVVPYDHNRVILTSPELGVLGGNETDYINASFIRGLPGKTGFIATQGPMLGTLEDFWSMVWAQTSGLVLMLCRLVENCQSQSYKLWPDVGECLDLDDINLSSEEEDTRSVYIIRKLSLLHNQTGERRTVTLLQFTAWPDTCLPCPGAMLNLWRAYRKLQDTSSGPPVVLCSNGSSRCGLFIALDNVVSLWEETATVDVVSCVVKTKEDRLGVLDSMEQYIYLYKCLVEVFLCETCATPEQGKLKKNMKNELIGQGDQRDNNENINLDWQSIHQEYQLINFQRPSQRSHGNIFVYPNTGVDSRCTAQSSDSGCWAHSVLYPDVTQDLLVTCLTLERRSVNRSSEGRVYRLRHSISLQESKMMLGISGVLPSHCQSSFLVCQSLSLSQAPDLWQLVFDTGCRTVVKLAKDTGGAKYEPWPLYTEDFSIEVESHHTMKDVLQETLLALSTNMEPWSPLDGDVSPETTIKMFAVPWSHDTRSCHVTPPADVIVFLYELLIRWLHQTKTTVIAVDCGGATATAVHFCAAFNLLSTMQTNQEVNVGQTVRAVQCPLSSALSQDDYFQLYRLRDHFLCHRGDHVNRNDKKLLCNRGFDPNANNYGKGDHHHKDHKHCKPVR